MSAAAGEGMPEPVVPEMCVDGKQRTLALRADRLHDGSMPVDRDSLRALKNLIADTDLILETTPDHAPVDAAN